VQAGSAAPSKPTESIGKRKRRQGCVNGKENEKEDHLQKAEGLGKDPLRRGKGYHGGEALRCGQAKPKGLAATLITRKFSRFKTHSKGAFYIIIGEEPLLPG